MYLVEALSFATAVSASEDSDAKTSAHSFSTSL